MDKLIVGFSRCERYQSKTPAPRISDMTFAHPEWRAVGRKAWIAARFLFFGVGGLYLVMRFSIEFLVRVTGGVKYAEQYMSPGLSLLFTVLGVLMILFGVGATDTRAQVASTPSRVTVRWRRFVSQACLVSAVCLIAATCLRFSQGAEWIQTVLLLSPFWLPYIFIPFRLRGPRIKSGFSLAMAIGGAAFLPGVALIYYIHEWGENGWIEGTLFVALLVQPILAVAAFRGLKSLPREPRDKRTLAVSGAYGCLLFAAFWLVALEGNFPSPTAYNESQAMESMRSLYMAADVYATDHDGAFPEDAATWGPGAKEECRAYYALTLASHQTEYGYIFDYHGGPSDKRTHGCRVAKSYTATARPAVFGKSGRRSFFVDQTHVIRFTSENRAATASDSELPAGSLPRL
jgi:hypothetical protein